MVERYYIIEVHFTTEEGEELFYLRRGGKLTKDINEACIFNNDLARLLADNSTLRNNLGIHSLDVRVKGILKEVDLRNKEWKDWDTEVFEGYIQSAQEDQVKEAMHLWEELILDEIERIKHYLKIRRNNLRRVRRKLKKLEKKDE